MEMIDDEDDKDSSQYLVFKCISHLFLSYFQRVRRQSPPSANTIFSSTGANPESSDLRLVSPPPVPGDDDYDNHDDYGDGGHKYADHGD